MTTTATIRRFGKPPAPPKGMPKGQQDLWKLAVDSFPADWFAGADLTLLTEMVRAQEMCDQLAVHIAKCETVGDLKPLLELRDRESRRAAALATKLRLPPQSRSDRHRAETAARSAGSPRPWERDPATDRFFKD